MADIFDNTILCKDCGKKMQKSEIVKNGFKLRALKCDCGNKIIHPEDLKEYEDYQHLKKKNYRVKLRLVGNSYAVSIPREIIHFMEEQEKRMKNMVDICLEDLKKISLNFE
ncbi:MAG: hypothetical protein ACP5D2_00170 [Candidatus Nanoarchaeia archaeon]